MSRPREALPEGFTVAELAAAAVEMDRVLVAEPELTDFGYGVFAQERKTAEARQTEFAQHRETIRRPISLAQFIAARRWLSQWGKLKSLNQRGSSYGLKHVAEDEIGYVTNGVFIAAAIAEGFRVRREGPNALFNISSTAWRGVEGGMWAGRRPRQRAAPEAMP
jgi:hypothetical protein